MDEKLEPEILAERVSYVGRERTLKSAAAMLAILMGMGAFLIVVVSIASYTGKLPNQPANPYGLGLAACAIAVSLLHAWSCYQLWRLRRWGLAAILSAALCGLLGGYQFLNFQPAATDYGYVVFHNLWARAIAAIFLLFSAWLVWLAVGARTRHIMTPEYALLRRRTPSIDGQVGGGARFFLSLFGGLVFIASLGFAGHITSPVETRQSRVTPRFAGHLTQLPSPSPAIPEKDRYGATELSAELLDSFSEVELRSLAPEPQVRYSEHESR